VDGPPAPPTSPTTPERIFPVIKLDPDPAGTRVIIGVGSRLGVNKTWKADFVDKNGRPVRGGQLTITFVEPAQTLATTSLTLDSIPKGVRAHVRPD
jgi:hypothetical protein